MKRICKILLVSILSLAMALSSMVFAFGVSEREGNDNISLANTISVNQTITGYSDKNSDEDWYKFTLNADGYISIKVNHEYGSTSQKVYLYAYDGSEKKEHLYDTVSKESETLTVAKHGLKKGTYYLLIYTGSKGNEYSFSVNYVKSDYWEKEFNDNVAQATPIKVNNTYYGSRAPGKADEDYYKFSVNNYSRIRVTLKHKYGIHNNEVYLYTYDGTSKEQILRKWVSKDSEQGSTDNIYLDTGTYFVMITGGEYSFNVECKDSMPTQPATTPPYTQQEEPSTRKPTTTNREEPSTQNAPATNRNEPSSNNGETTTWAPIEVPEHPDGATYIYQNFYYSNYETHVVIDYYIGEDTVVEIPAEIDGLPVVTLGTSAFESSTAQEITVPSTIKNFGDDAFGQSDGKSRKIICEAGSEAEKYAIDNNIPYETKKEIETKPTQSESVDKTEETERDNSRMIIIILVAVIVALMIAIGVGIAIMIIKKKEMEGK